MLKNHAKSAVENQVSNGSQKRSWWKRIHFQTWMWKWFYLATNIFNVVKRTIRHMELLGVHIYAHRRRTWMCYSDTLSCFSKAIFKKIKTSPAKKWYFCCHLQLHFLRENCICLAAAMKTLQHPTTIGWFCRLFSFTTNHPYVKN